MRIYDINPFAKPRMTQQDKWKKREVVERYFRFKDQVKARGIKLPESNYHVIFVLPMPKSWPKKKRNMLRGKAHQQTPDKDNLEKALLDAVYQEDSVVWDGRTSKFWGDRGYIIVLDAEPVKTVNEYIKNMK